MYRYIAYVSVVLLIACCFYIFTLNHGTARAGDMRPVFINLTCGKADPQKASMALMLASRSREVGREVTVYVNVRGLNIATKDCELKMYNREEKFSEKFSQLIAGGVTVIACPYCMERNDIKVRDLLKGIEVAHDENFWGTIDDGAVVFSY